MDEQQFLATLQECLQADNEKRTAAEVSPCFRPNELWNLSLSFPRQSIKKFRMNKKRFS